MGTPLTHTPRHRAQAAHRRVEAKQEDTLTEAQRAEAGNPNLGQSRNCGHSNNALSLLMIEETCVDHQENTQYTKRARVQLAVSRVCLRVQPIRERGASCNSRSFRQDKTRMADPSTS